jgi:ABC-type multidrug transport system ATPase subunit
VQIVVDHIGKKFVREWIIRDATFILETGQKYVFLGPNGSGKSTCLQLLTGMFPVSEGTINYISDLGLNIGVDDWYKYLVISAPYMELVEEFTLREHVDFHRKFKPLKNNISSADFEDFIQLPSASNKIIRHFSSGMKQRLKLGLAFMSDVPIVFLDEPTTNLDQQGIEWYLENVTQLGGNQLVILGSNVKQEYEFCENIISVSSFK